MILCIWHVPKTPTDLRNCWLYVISKSTCLETELEFTHTVDGKNTACRDRQARVRIRLDAQISSPWIRDLCGLCPRLHRNPQMYLTWKHADLSRVYFDTERSDALSGWNVPVSQSNMRRNKPHANENSSERQRCDLAGASRKVMWLTRILQDWARPRPDQVQPEIKANHKHKVLG